MITEVCVATYELNPAFAEAYALEQEDRVVGIVLNPEASAEQIASWQARVADAIDEEVSGERRPRACSKGWSTACLPSRCASTPSGRNPDRGRAAIGKVSFWRNTHRGWVARGGHNGQICHPGDA